jgi:nitrite reductase/ring-hydroxylating ferredoxin subunit
VSDLSVNASVEAERRRRPDLFVLFGWFTLTAVLLGFAFSLFQFLSPQVLYEPERRIVAGFAKDFPLVPGKISVHEHLSREHGIAIVATGDGIYALRQLCTYSRCGGAPLRWVESSQRFKCPCCGSQFDVDGDVRAGPAPRGLPHYALHLGPGGKVIVESLRYSYLYWDRTKTEFFIKKEALP